MKVALLTFHDTTNFGSFLQTYGLYSTLNKLEIDCEVLNYQCAADPAEGTSTKKAGELDN